MNKICKHCGSEQEDGHRCIGDCISKFDNIKEYTGFPTIPQRNLVGEKYLPPKMER